MTALPDTSAHIVGGLAVVDRPEDLSAIRDAACAGAIWLRHPLPDVQRWIDGLDPAHLPRTRTILRPEAVRGTVDQVCDAAGTPNCAERVRLVDDIAAMADIFTRVMGARWLRLRLDVVVTNACRKFHVDAVMGRLVCTYRGSGTQYGFVREDNEPAEIFSVPTGSPVLLRGTLWPERPDAGLRHRSPPIEGSGETRLVLVLDPVNDPEDEI